MGMIFCTNKNDFHHEDRYDGEEYHFPPNEKVALSEEAARHMFGFRLIDKGPALSRLGWDIQYDAERRAFVNNPEGVKKLAKFVFTEAVMIEKPVEEKPVDTKPEDKTLHLKKPEQRV